MSQSSRQPLRVALLLGLAPLGLALFTRDHQPTREPALSIEKDSPNRLANRAFTFEYPTKIESSILADSHFPHPLFERQTSEPPGPLSQNRHTLSFVEARTNWEHITEYLSSPNEWIKLPLTDTLTASVKIDQVTKWGPLSYVLTGKVSERPHSQVVLVFHDHAVSGSIAFYTEDRHYQFGMAGNGQTVIRHLDPAGFPETCGTTDPPLAHSDSPPLAPSLNNEGTSLDTVIGYSKGAREYLGSTAAMEAHILAAVTRMNLAFANSGVSNVQLVLLGTIEDPDYVFPGSDPDNLYDEHLDLALTAPHHPELNTVTNFREALGGDTVGFIVDDGSGGHAGIATIGGQTFPQIHRYIVSVRHMNSRALTLAHEVGHTIGCSHGWADSSHPADIEISSAHGWRPISPEDGEGHRTLMAYPGGAGFPVIPHFSNPSILFEGARTGCLPGYDATGDPTVDQRLAGRGIYLDGLHGNGHDGSHAQLGANNAKIIIDKAYLLARQATRAPTAPDISVAVEQEDLRNGESQLLFDPLYINISHSKTVTIRNSQLGTLGGLQLTLTGPDKNLFAITPLDHTSLPLGASTDFDITFQSSTLLPAHATLLIESNDPDEGLFEIPLIGDVQDPSLRLENQSFETQLSYPDWGYWYRDPESGSEWVPNNFGLPADPFTGPAAASHGEVYLSLISQYLSSATIQIDLDLSNHEGALHMTFDYHMYGADMGQLIVDVFHSGSWHLGIWSRAGQQHSSENSPWSEAQVDLTNYTGQSDIIVRIRGLKGSGPLSEMAIDNISFGLMPYHQWAHEGGLFGTDALPEAIPHHDGVPNLLKYACGLNPGQADHRTLVPETGTSGLPVLFETPTGYRFQFLRRKQSPLTYAPLQSTDLTSDSWGTANGIQSSLSLDEEWEQVNLDLPTDTSSLFLKLKISMP